MIYLIKKTYFKVGPNRKKRVLENVVLDSCCGNSLASLLFTLFVDSYNDMKIVSDEQDSKTFVNNVGDFINIRLCMQQYCPNKHYRCF